MEFTKVPECIDYCKEKNLSFFRRDLNDKFAKIMVADTFENIYNKIMTTSNHWYESWNGKQSMKLYIDYDKKIESEPENLKDKVKKLKNEQNNTGISHKNDILNIINLIRQIIPTISGVYILKSIPDTTKKSYHIIFDGIHFQCLHHL